MVITFLSPLQDLVNDLMATIARLDSNGIKVIAEPPRKPGDSPLVDSSTGPPIDLLANVRTVQTSIANTPAGSMLMNTFHFVK